ncbi:unnamed protein product [Fraxinus pennsylvanica]|uniref:Uncharacterized protein n=1 Tax=Fraxinus pennsylvanica TaxID=56036 RepID=A0AAD1ZC44_9LAMI|nr:unnamed protein product [Fraxinus pennsylvanica]
MLSFDEGEEVFFDTRDYLSNEPVIVKEDSDLGYEIWLREPNSVKERRESFLKRMDFVECQSPHELETMGVERVIQSTEVISSSCGLCGPSIGDHLVCKREELDGGANYLVHDSDRDWLDDMTIDAERQINENPLCTEQYKLNQIRVCSQENNNVSKMKKKNKMMHCWKHFVQKMRKNRGTKSSNEAKLVREEVTMSWMKMEQHKKRFMECTAVYAVQEISAHDGLIWTMKFSPDGQYLASGGEDGLVCIWRVTSLDPFCKTSKYNFGIQSMEGKSSSQRQNLSGTSIVIPERIFHIEEQPLKKFSGHAVGVLDVAWSTTNHILSSSMDKTVRLWHVDSDKCLGVFYHSNYVSCVQFNPADENYFISGSIDGKVRIWGVHDRRVLDWANVRDVVTAVCYQPNGKGFIVGSVSGNCRFYEKSGIEFLLNAEIAIRGRKKSPGNKITGIQFLKNESRRVMVTSEDSKIHILDRLKVVRKYRGLPKSKTQASASFTSSGRHIISVGEDCRIYVWNYDDLIIQTSKQAKPVRSCEHFFFQGVSVALPWSGVDTEQDSSACDCFQPRQQTHDHQEASLRVQDSGRFSLANWFSMDGSSGSSITWPEEKLPLWDLPPSEHDSQPCNNYSDHLHPQKLKNNSHGSRILSTAWGLVILTAGRDGMIRTFHNYGLPIKT